MLGTMLRERLVCPDKTIQWTTNEAANTVKRIDIPKPSAPVSEYMLSVLNPSTQSDLTVRIFAEECVNNTSILLSLVRTISIPKASSALSAWAANTLYAKDDTHRPLNILNGHKYKITTAGTSGASQPVWPTAPQATVTDGTAEWVEDGLDLTGACAVSVYLHGIFNGTNLVILVSNDTGGALQAFDAIFRLREVM